MEDLIKKINGLTIIQTDNLKNDPKEIEQEKLNNAYNQAIQDVLSLLKSENNCEHEWFDIPSYIYMEADWQLCKKCKTFKKTTLKTK